MLPVCDAALEIGIDPIERIGGRLSAGLQTAHCRNPPPRRFHSMSFSNRSCHQAEVRVNMPGVTRATRS